VNPLNPLYVAVAWVLKQLYNVLSPIFGDSSGWTWALTIVLLVVIMRLIMVPLFIKQMHTTRRMTALAPQMTALRKKYKNDKQTLNTEMMKLYQEAGVNPLMGCLPVVAQLPIFFALFSVLRAIAEWQPGDPPKYGLTTAMMESAQHAKILGATIADKFLSSSTPLHAKIVILFAVVVSMITTYLTVRQSMKRGMMPTTPDSPMGNSQKYMAYIMPFFALSGLYWPFGLVLYWVTTNLWTLGQQYVLFTKFPAPAVAGTEGSSSTPVITTAKPSLRPGRGRKTDPPPAGQPGDARTGGQAPADGKPAAGGKPAPASGKPAGTARPAGQQARKPAASSPSGQAQGNGGQAARKPAASGKPASSSGKPTAAPGKPAAARKPAAGSKPASSRPMGPSRPVSSSRPAPANGSDNGSDGRGGMLRRFGLGRSEPAPEQPAEPEVKLVRQQRQRQSRSKRKG
jgi:YidC/Oxa1 family membrane protein insertase